ncbi:MAG: PorV/PorQ family protein [Elusimicrobiota bacterium]
MGAIIILFCLVCVSSADVFADILRTPGVAGMPFLKIGLSARPQGIAETFTSLGDDVSSIEYNPAGIGRASKNELQIAHVVWFEDVTLHGLFFAHRLGKSVFGLAASMLQAQDRVRTLVQVNDTSAEVRETETINLNDSAFSMVYSAYISEGVYLGFSAKYLNEKLYSMNNYALAGDVGILYFSEATRSSYGFSIQNAGSAIGGDILPATARLGFGTHSDGYNFGLDIIQRIDSKIKVSMGLEMFFSKMFVFRGGVFYQQAFNFTGGLGIGLAEKNPAVWLDYAYLPNADFGTAHRISLLFKF